MHYGFDAVLLVCFFLAQWRIRQLLLAAVARRAPSRLALARAASVAALALLAVGSLLSFTEMVSRLGLPAGLCSIAGGATVVYLLCSSAGYAIFGVVRGVSRMGSESQFDPSRRRLFHAAGGALIASPFVVVGYGALVQRTNFQVREVDVPVPHLPRDLEGLRLLQLSDIHLSAFLSEQELARVIDAANGTRAHVALVTGDLISARGDPLDACLRQLARLRTDAGTIGCLGNHERYAQAEQDAAEDGAKLGMRFLRNQAVKMSFGSAAINFAGVDYQRFSLRKNYIPGAERMVAPDALNIMLSHNPDVFPTAAKKGYNLTISGHTHGGQVTVEILDRSINAARFFTPFVYGLYRTPQASAYVTRGIGTIGIPARIGAPPEITVLRLVSA